jgi:putative transcriptional regulator
MYRYLATLSLMCAAITLGAVTTATAQTDKAQRGPIVLVAARHLVDPNFAHTVVLVMFPPETGPIGIVLNRPTDLQLREIWPGQEQRQGRTDTIYIGGPVQPDGLLYLFRKTPPPEHAWPVVDDIYLSGNGELLEMLLEQTHPVADQRLFAGYAGWRRGQLEGEIANRDWYVFEADPEIIYDTDSETLWWRLYQRATLPRADFSGPGALACQACLPDQAWRGQTADSRDPLPTRQQ